MNLKPEDYRRALEEGYEEISGQDHSGRLEYLSDHIFDFTTYDGEMAELFARKALEVCAAISDRRTFEYIATSPENYRWYLLMCNMPFFAGKLEWGTSIRGAWWDASPRGKIEFDSCGLFLDGRQYCQTMQFSAAQWIEFIAAILQFAGDEFRSANSTIKTKERRQNAD